MIDRKYHTLIKEVREISSDIARLDADLTKDRHNLANLEVNMAGLSEEVKQLRKQMESIKRDVGHEVKDTLRPAVKEVTKLKNEIKGKKSIIIKRGEFLAWFKQRIKRG